MNIEKENNDKYLNKVDKNFARKFEKLNYWAKRMFNVNMFIISGLRSYKEQSKLYTNFINGVGGLAAPPGKSYHNYGLAVDFKLTDDNGKNISNEKFYKNLIALSLSTGLVSGLQFGDVPHIQDSIGRNINTLYDKSYGVGKEPVIDSRGVNIIPYLIGGTVLSVLLVGGYLVYQKK